jgi:ADP-ribosyl-[dinitrogen reductase] hydrolase
MGAPPSAKPTPLRNSYWVIPGKVLAGEHPSGSNREATRDKLQRLIGAGVECFIDLTEPNEIKPYDRELPFSIEYLRKPIKDHSTPAQRVHMAEILDCMHDALQSGRCVYVHCRAGIGRTGTVIGCFLVERGLPGESALDELNRLWQQCERSHSWASIPETSDQTNYVVRWKRRGIFDDRGGLTTPNLQSPDEDDLRSGGAPAPWAHLLDNEQAKSGAPRSLPNAPRSPASGSAAAAKGSGGAWPAGAKDIAVVARSTTAEDSAAGGAAAAGKDVAARGSPAATKATAAEGAPAAGTAIAAGGAPAAANAAVAGGSSSATKATVAGGAPAANKATAAGGARATSKATAAGGSPASPGATRGPAAATAPAVAKGSTSGASATVGSPADAAPYGGGPSANALPHTALSSPLGVGAPRAAAANAARAAARESDGEELLTDPTSVSKLPQAQSSRPGVPRWIAAGSSTATQAFPNSAQPLSHAAPAPSPSPGSSAAAASGASPASSASAAHSTPSASGPASAGSRAAVSGPPRTGGRAAAAPSSTAAATEATHLASGSSSPSSPQSDAATPATANNAPRSAGQRARPGGATASDTSTARSQDDRSGSPHRGAAPSHSPATVPQSNSGVFPAVAGDVNVDPLLDPEALAAASILRGRFLGALIGLAVGDAVAAATQYRRPGSFTPVGDMLGGGPFDLPRGGWSDDTSMALCLADSLLERNGFDARDQMERYRRWQQQGYLSATGQCVGITASTARAIAMAQWRRQALFGSHDPSQQDPEPLSRVAAAVLFFFAISGEAVNQATEAARTTCQAPAVLDSCRALARALYAALTGQPKVTVLEMAALAVPTTVTAVAATAASDAGATPVAAQRVGSSAPAALAAAVAAFGATDNFRDAILYAANLGGDSDVVAAVCGQLAGAYYSVKAIPTSWHNGLMQKELITAYADRLLAHALVGLGG